jgi:hypothetical protein
MLIAVVITANHYIVDVVAGVMVAVIALQLAFISTASTHSGSNVSTGAMALRWCHSFPNPRSPVPRRSPHVRQARLDLEVCLVDQIARAILPLT